MNINHVVGNNKIFFIKKSAKLLSYIILLVLSLFLKINRKNSELIISTAFYAPWKDNKNFTSIYHKIKKLTLLDHARAYTLWYLSNDLKNLNGNIFDLGCLQGGAGFVMSKANKKGSTYLFDTFEGFLEEGKYHKKKHFVYENIKEVKKNISKLNLKNTKVFKCKFPFGIKPSIKNKKIKLCHIDVNTHNSTKNAFSFVKNKMVKGGAIVFDDYGIYTADNIKRYVHIISKKHKKDFSFIYNYMGQCILIKK